MTAAEVLAECRTMLLEILPELSAHRHYVVDVTETNLPKEHFGGFCEPYVPSNVFDLDCWDGPGSVIAIDASGLAPARAPRFALAHAKAVAVHEGSHWEPPSRERVDYLDAVPLATIQASIARESEIPAEQCEAALTSHGVGFIRRASHLWYRAAAHGHEVRPSDVLGYSHLSPLQFYWPAFADECVRLRFAPLSVIDAEPMPQLAKALHAGDLERYRQSQAKEQAA